MKQCVKICIVLSLAGAGADMALRPLGAATVMLPASADTSLFQNNPNNNLGGMTFLPIGTTQGGNRSRGLFKFDVAGSVPSGATITGARFTATVTFSPIGSSFSCNLHRVLKDWGEGNKFNAPSGSSVVGAQATTGEATWNHRFFSATSWSAPGAQAGSDYVTTVSATQTFGSTGSRTFSSTNMLADVRLWHQDAGTNFGWILLVANESTLHTARRFGASESAVASERPSLAIDFELPLRIDRVEVSQNQFRIHFQTQAGRAYTVERRGVVEGGSWTVITNLPTQTMSASVVISDVVGSTNAFYRVGQQ